MKSMIAFLVIVACIFAVGQAAGLGFGGLGLGLGGVGLGHYGGGYPGGVYPGGALIAGPSGIIRTGGHYPGAGFGVVPGYGYGRRAFY